MHDLLIPVVIMAALAVGGAFGLILCILAVIPGLFKKMHEALEQFTKDTAEMKHIVSGTAHQADVVREFRRQRRERLEEEGETTRPDWSPDWVNAE